MISRERFKEIIDTSLDRLRGMESLIEVNADRVLVIGDLHGDVNSLEKVINDYPPGRWLYIGLGDYVDRGDYQVETLERVLRLFLQGVMIPLRGNHESYIMNEAYGFIDDALPVLGSKLLNRVIHELFPMLPYAAIVNNKVLLLHGGLAKGLSRVEEIRRLERPDDEPSNPIAFQILWNDPSDEVSGFVDSPRGAGIYLFGPDVTRDFLNTNNLSIIIRGHSYLIEGYWKFHEGKVLSIFTSSSGPYALTKPKVAAIIGNRVVIIDVESGREVYEVNLR